MVVSKGFYCLKSEALKYHLVLLDRYLNEVVNLLIMSFVGNKFKGYLVVIRNIMK